MIPNFPRMRLWALTGMLLVLAGCANLGNSPTPIANGIDGNGCRRGAEIGASGQYQQQPSERPIVDAGGNTIHLMLPPQIISK